MIDSPKTGQSFKRGGRKDRFSELRLSDDDRRESGRASDKSFRNSDIPSAKQALKQV